MVQIQTRARLVPANPLRSLACNLLIRHGLHAQDAELVADSLIESNLRGIDSHGIARLPHYLNRIQHGSITPRPAMQLRQVADACAILDGNHALGQIVMAKAADVAMDMARHAGAGWVAVQNSSHCGALAYFGLHIARHNMIGLVFTHVDPMVLPHGSKQPFCGTNPICITAPGENDSHLCLDMATSIVPWNTVANAATEHVPIPTGWAVDQNGQDTTDASRVAALYPFGTYKGSGLGLMIDVLCSLLSNSPYGPDIPKMYGDPTQHRLLGGLVGAIDIAHFTQPTRARRRISQIIQRWTNLEPAPDARGRVLFPGQPELKEKSRRLKLGIPVGLELFKSLNALAKKHDVNPLPIEESNCG